MKHFYIIFIILFNFSFDAIGQKYESIDQSAQRLKIKRFVDKDKSEIWFDKEGRRIKQVNSKGDTVEFEYNNKNPKQVSKKTKVYHHSKDKKYIDFYTFTDFDYIKTEILTVNGEMISSRTKEYDKEKRILQDFKHSKTGDTLYFLQNIFAGRYLKSQYKFIVKDVKRGKVSKKLLETKNLHTYNTFHSNGQLKQTTKYYTTFRTNDYIKMKQDLLETQTEVVDNSKIIKRTAEGITTKSPIHSYIVYDEKNNIINYNNEYQYIFEYNDCDKLVGRTKIQIGKKHLEYKASYNDDCLITFDTYYSKGGGITQKNRYKYDKANRLIEKKDISTQGNRCHSGYEWKYNNDSILIYELEYCDNTNNKIFEKYYNDIGQIVKDISYYQYSNNSINYFYYYKYDDQNRLILKASNHNINQWSFGDTSSIQRISSIQGNFDDEPETILIFTENNNLDSLFLRNYSLEEYNLDSTFFKKIFFGKNNDTTKVVIEIFNDKKEKTYYYSLENKKNKGSVSQQWTTYNDENRKMSHKLSVKHFEFVSENSHQKLWLDIPFNTIETIYNGKDEFISRVEKTVNSSGKITLRTTKKEFNDSNKVIASYYYIDDELVTKTTKKYNDDNQVLEHIGKNYPVRGRQGATLIQRATFDNKGMKIKESEKLIPPRRDRKNKTSEWIYEYYD